MVPATFPRIQKRLHGTNNENKDGLMVPMTITRTQEWHHGTSDDYRDPGIALWYQRRLKGPMSGPIIPATFPETKG